MRRLWRLTRNRYGRAVYERLAAVGLTATWMTEYVASLERAPSITGDADVDVGVVSESERGGTTLRVTFRSER